MSHSYKCGQYEDAYRPSRLRNWSNPRWDPEKPYRDPFNYKPTEVIVNERGHLLPGSYKKNHNPWNNYIGNYDMPSFLTKALANDIGTRPASCIEYLDKPNPIKPPIKEPSTKFRHRPGCSRAAEGPDTPDQRTHMLTPADYAEHEKKIEEANEKTNKFIKHRNESLRKEAERVCRARQLARELWRQRECQRRAKVQGDVEWLRTHRQFHNLVPKQLDWSKDGAPQIPNPSFGVCDFGGCGGGLRSPDGGEGYGGERDKGGVKGRCYGGGGKGGGKNSGDYGGIQPENSYHKTEQIQNGTNDQTYVECFPIDVREKQKHDGGSKKADEEGFCVNPNDTSLFTQSQIISIQELDGSDGGSNTMAPAFYCPVKRDLGKTTSAVTTGPLVDSNVAEGYVSKKIASETRGVKAPDHQCTTGCGPNIFENGDDDKENKERLSPSLDPLSSSLNQKQCDDGIHCGTPERRECYSPVPSRSLDERGDCQNPSGLEEQNLHPEYPQFEDTSQVLRNPRPDSPVVEPGFPERAVNDPAIRSYPRQDLLLRPDYPDLYTIRSCKPVAIQAQKNCTDGHSLSPRLEQTESLQIQSLSQEVPQATIELPRSPLPPPPPPPPSANVSAQFSLIGDPVDSAKPSAPPQRAPPAAPTALAAAPAASVAAKELQRANLVHQPLADAVPDAAFCRLAARGHPNPGIALDCSSAASGVGWRPFNTPGPTNCSKQRVYRPHTAGCGMHNTAAGVALAKASRPATAATRRRHVSAIQLAIGWDTVPDYPEDEPRPPKHVDGSNGSAAPGIFCRVPAPERTPALPTPPLAQIQNHPPDMDSIRARLNKLQHERAASASMAAEACLRSALAKDRRRHGSADGDPRNLEDHIAAGLKVSVGATKEARRRLSRRATAQQTEISPSNRSNRSCEACSVPNNVEPQNTHRLPPAPAPFKAGKAPVCLNTNSSFDGGGSSGSGGGSAAVKTLHVPRPRQPFSSRGYAITTLAQPFAMDKNGSAGGAYPEHWRLASVYQLSYKPLPTRNKPLIKTVFQ